MEGMDTKQKTQTMILISLIISKYYESNPMPPEASPAHLGPLQLPGVDVHHRRLRAHAAPRDALAAAGHRARGLQQLALRTKSFI